MRINIHPKRALTAVLFAIIFLHATSFSQTITFDHKGYSRNCIVHLPAGYNDSIQYPLVFNLHGRSTNNSLQQLYSAMDAVADTGGFIVAYPDGINNGWDTIAFNSPVDDVGFINRLLDTMILKYSIDTDRVYSTGLSMGGFMTYRLGCELGERFAAIASVSGPTVDLVMNACNSAPRISVLHIHGTADSTIPYAGATLEGIYFHPVDSTIQYFVNKNGCASTPVVYNFPDVVTSDGCTVTSYHYNQCQDSTEVLLYKVIGGGHTWPGGFPLPFLGNTDGDIKASVEIWNFFRRHKRHSIINTSVHSPPSTSLQVFPNPASGMLHIELPENNAGGILWIQLFDLTGKIQKVIRSPSQKQVSINLQELVDGVYLMRVNADGKVYRASAFIYRSNISN